MWLEAVVEIDAGCLVDKVGFMGLVLSEYAGDGREAVSDVGWVDIDGWVRLDLFS